ncbi:hypothetical protein EV188_105311 [Actinomycetospora succinea]|uniref:Uncharacterized protein n=1 Tax=Actinomycetospora succinea TaxID=663603 RepID=A0A4R6V6K4_9PSEU|nr:hypothetical protein EV188_105311 [Actinomycetospora succinea]
MRVNRHASRRRSPWVTRVLIALDAVVVVVGWLAWSTTPPRPPPLQLPAPTLHQPDTGARDPELPPPTDGGGRAR